MKRRYLYVSNDNDFRNSLADFIFIITIKSFTKPLYQILNNIKLIKRGEYDLSDISNTSIENGNLCIALDDMAQHVTKKY